MAEDLPCYLSSRPSRADSKLWHKQALDYTADAAKQQITIAAGVVTATAIFLKDVAGFWPRFMTITGWVPLLLSIILGMFVLSSLAGVSRRAALGRIEMPVLEKDILDTQTWQYGAFFAGIVFIALSGLLTALTHSKIDDSAKVINNVATIAPNSDTPCSPQILQTQTPLPAAATTTANPRITAHHRHHH